LNNKLEFIQLFEELKLKYVENIEIFNKLNLLKLDNGTNVLNSEDRMKMIKNINTILKTLSLHSDINPEYNLNLLNLPELNIEPVRQSSPEFTESALQMRELNVKVEES
jgi:hypothetical protein